MYFIYLFSSLWQELNDKRTTVLSSGTLNYIFGGSGSFGDLKNTFQVDKSSMHNGQKGFCKSGRVCACFISSSKWWTYCSSLSWNSRYKICNFFIIGSTHCACKLRRYFSDHQRSSGLPLHTCNVIRNPFAHVVTLYIRPWSFRTDNFWHYREKNR